jgi:hypothetical protein
VPGPLRFELVGVDLPLKPGEGHRGIGVGRSGLLDATLTTREGSPPAYTITRTSPGGSRKPSAQLRGCPGRHITDASGLRSRRPFPRGPRPRTCRDCWLASRSTRIWLPPHASADLACWCHPHIGPCHASLLALVVAGAEPLDALAALHQ